MDKFNNKRKDYSKTPSQYPLFIDGRFGIQSTLDIIMQYNNTILSAILTETGVITGVYTNPTIEVDSKGRILNISSGSGGGGNPLTIASITGDGTLGNEIRLVNDDTSPGNNKYYGTDGSGTKGYYNLPSGGGSALEIKNNGTTIDSNVDEINFVGQPVTQISAGKVDVELLKFTTDANISFLFSRIYNTVASPKTGNITEDLTNAVSGVINKIYHNDTVAPTYPAGWVRISTTAYEANKLNIIYCEYVSGSRVEYWITQEN